MKKIMTILAIMFATALTAIGQDNVIKNSTFYLNDGTNLSTDLVVAVNPTDVDAIEDGGTIIITFNDFIDFTEITGIGTSDMIISKLDNGAVYSIKFNYEFLSTTNKMINYNPNTVFTFITEQDTVDAYNNGVSSVDTQSYFDAGVASVVVDTLDIWNGGYNAGVVEGENTSADDAYNAGYADGTNSGTSVNNFAVTNLNVYPNPASTSGNVNVECDGFNNVTVYSITGQEVFKSFNSTFNVSDFTNSAGTYLLSVEDNEFNVTNTRLLVQ